MRVLSWIAVVVLAAATSVIASLFIDIDWVGNTKQTEIDLTYADLAAISMGAAALALGACALIVTLLAFFGVAQIKREAARLARTSADEEIRQRLDKILTNRLDEAIKRELPRRMEAVLYGNQAVTDADVAADTREDEG